MAVGSSAATCSLRMLALTAAALALLGATRATAAEWQPAGIRPTSATLADVLDANAKASGSAAPGFAVRRERWTYTNGAHVLPVTVAVRGDTFRVDVVLDGATYSAGRLGGARWRADANGIYHGTQADLQSDAIDRFPAVLLGFRAHDCALVGTSGPPNPAWVIADRPAGERVQWLFVDQTSGLIVKSVVREGKVVETTVFDRFTTTAAPVRPQHWHVSDGERADDIDATLDGVEAGSLPEDAIGLPPASARRVFAPLDPRDERIVLPATFSRRGSIDVEVSIDGHRHPFVLDTGTASITLDADLARRETGPTVLGHARVGIMTVGGLRLENASTLAIPLFGGSLSGILGYDFFFGHVVHIDYRNGRVEVLSGSAAENVFTDPSIAVEQANVDQGLPLLRAQVAAASGNDFALDTGSTNLYVMQPFAERNAAEIAAHWTRLREVRLREEYLEGAIEIVPYRAATMSLGPVRFLGVDVGVEVPSKRPDALSIPFDGIIGSDILRRFELWFDYDNHRVGMRYTGG